MSPVAIIFWILGMVNPSVSPAEGIANLYQYYDAVAMIESDMNRYAVSRTTSSSSYFQLTLPAFETAKKRAARYGWYIKAKYPGELNYQEQRDLVIIDLYARKGTNGFIKLLAQGNLWAAKQAYFKFHHTNPDRATTRRAIRIFKERYNAKR